jgi:hypothetical protein
MTSFLGVSIRYQGQLFGRLFLANNVTAQGLATNFSELDEQVVLTLVAQAGITIQNLQLLHASKEQARHDPLTELLNHSAILNVLTQELSRAERNRYPVAVPSLTSTISSRSTIPMGTRSEIPSFEKPRSDCVRPRAITITSGASAEKSS